MKKFTTIVADTSDFETIREFQAKGCDDESEKFVASTILEQDINADPAMPPGRAVLTA